MHEYSIIGALLEQVEAEATRHSASSVKRVWVKLGEQSGVDPDLLQKAYEIFRERSICENAVLVLTAVPVSWACARCNAPIPVGAPLRCSECNVPATLRAGDEIVLERIEMEA
jgi:hydrogenase nickel incorporation protein HypA/HybF